MPETTDRIYSTRTPREEWPETFRDVVQMFEQADVERPERGAFHAQTSAPIRPDGGDEYTWHVLFAPERVRTVWKIDGQPLKHEETAHGAGPDDMVAKTNDVTDIEKGRVEVFVALTKVAGIHSRAENWLPSDDSIREQFDRIRNDLEPTERGRVP